MEIIYKTIIYYELDYETRPNYSEDLDRMESGLWKATEGLKVERSSNSGGPCWGPYFEMECDDLKDLEKAYNKGVNYLKRWKGAIVS